MPPDTLQATLDHGVSALTLDGTEEEANATLAALATAGVDMDAVTDKLLSDGVNAFAGSYRQLLETIETKCGMLAQARS